MWILICLFGVSTLTIMWTCFGYFLYVWAYGLLRPRASSSASTADPSLPFLSVIVPCYNEAQNVAEKLANTRALDYPREQIEVIFIDGGSTDGTFEWLASHATEPWIRVQRASRTGKTHQLNEVLRDVRGQVVVNSDCDALLAPNVLEQLALRLQQDRSMGVVGAYCRPREGIAVDIYYWDAQNKGRILEARAGTSSIAIACCYAFRRELINQFPDDVIADDVYIALAAHVTGLTVGFCEEAAVYEMRGARSISEFFPHKFRKSNAYLREMLRFLYRLPELKPLQKLIFLSRLAQQLILPWALGAWATLTLALLTLFRWDIVGLGTFTLFISFVATSQVFAMTKLPDGRRPASLLVVGSAYVFTNLLLMITSMSYPFYQQSSNYARVGEDIETGKLRPANDSELADELMDRAS